MAHSAPVSYRINEGGLLRQRNDLPLQRGHQRARDVMRATHHSLRMQPCAAQPLGSEGKIVTTYTPHNVADLARAVPPAPVPQPDAATGSLPTAALVLGGLALAGFGIKYIFDTPSRTYDNNVGEEYDAWTEEGVLEYYWGEHIHLGYYTEEVGTIDELYQQRMMRF